MSELVYIGTPVEDTGDVKFTPIVTSDGQVGYQVEQGGRVGYVYFNPSNTEDHDEPEPEVFVYAGTANDPLYDQPLHFYSLGEFLSDE